MPATVFDADKGIHGSAWQAAQATYSRAWYYYDGEVFLERTRGSDGKPGAYKFPTRANYVRLICNLLAAYVTGQPVREDEVVQIFVRGDQQSTQEAGELINAFLREQRYGDIVRVALRNYMIAGGVYFKVRYNPQATYRATIDLLDPRNVFPVWNPINLTELRRCHIKVPITTDFARELGAPIEDSPATCYYLESWDDQAWNVYVGYENDWIQVAGDRHPLGRVPIVYMPRLRTDQFYGQSLVDEIYGLNNELNARIADEGDAVAQATHPGGWGHDIRLRSRSGLQITGPDIIDLGDTPPGGTPPYIEQFDPPNITDGISTFVDALEDLLYDMAAIPPVMRGVDEGSQRSGITLAMRALPTIAMIGEYRHSLIAATREIARLFFLTCWAYRESPNSGLNGVYRSWADYDLVVTLPPVLPRDRMELADFIVKMRAARTMSRQRGVELQQDVLDVNQELAAIAAEEQAKQTRKGNHGPDADQQQP